MQHMHKHDPDLHRNRCIAGHARRLVFPRDRTRIWMLTRNHLIAHYYR